MDCSGDGIVDGAVAPIRKLERIQGTGEDRLDVLYDQPFKARHEDGSECNWAVVVKQEGERFFGTGMMVLALRHR